LPQLTACRDLCSQLPTAAHGKTSRDIAATLLASDEELVCVAATLLAGDEELVGVLGQLVE
jgi:hypothetical protein